MPLPSARHGHVAALPLLPTVAPVRAAPALQVRAIAAPCGGVGPRRLYPRQRRAAVPSRPMAARGSSLHRCRRPGHAAGAPGCAATVGRP